jgi:hypothetical protein
VHIRIQKVVTNCLSTSEGWLPSAVGVWIFCLKTNLVRRSSRYVLSIRYFNKYAEANKKYMEDYDEDIDKTFMVYQYLHISYLDANILFRC